MKIQLTLCASAILLLTGCGPSEPEPSGEKPPTPAPKRVGKPVVLASFYPLQYLAERLAGDLAVVSCPLPADADAATWQPDDAAIAAMQKADLILINGANFESWPRRVNLPASRLVDTTSLMKRELLEYENAIKHAHGNLQEHAHEGIDGHTWLDPVNLKIQTSSIHQALKKLLPDESDVLDERLNLLIEDLNKLHQEISAVSGELPIIASHAAYNYLAKRYDWNLQNLDLDPAKPLEPHELENIKRLLSRHPTVSILWETEPLQETQDLLKRQFGLSCKVFDPCEQPPKSDYLAVMRSNIENIRGILR